ncbi:hypothetical protein Gogos_016493, partial [Gossypium gossypioides]|nr:hypothetical protein [Gossypium gossypioides]
LAILYDINDDYVVVLNDDYVVVFLCILYNLPFPVLPLSAAILLKMEEQKPKEQKPKANENKPAMTDCAGADISIHTSEQLGSCVPAKKQRSRSCK